MLVSFQVQNKRDTPLSSCKYILFSNARLSNHSSCLNKDQHTYKTIPFDGVDTIWKAFNYSLLRFPDIDWLGSRDPTQPGAPYVWKSWKTVAGIVDDLAHGYVALNLIPVG